MALYSPVFYAMFFSKFSERDKKEIPVEDVILDEFIELLNVVYPSHKAVSGKLVSICHLAENCAVLLILCKTIINPFADNLSCLLAR